MTRMPPLLISFFAMQLRERMARTSWESLTLTAAGVAATGEDLGDAATVLLPGANDIPDQRRDVDIVRGGEAAEEERQRVGAHGEAAKERHGRSCLGEDAANDEVIEDGDGGLVSGGRDRGKPVEGDGGATGTSRGRRGGREAWAGRGGRR
uniref:Uncharacterized protein n=1 Tax=Oryza sativa subsp. japonica TaxID=39947 RepID=Q7XDE8_ORYSJ|nr:hypothetical protein LOC_Os10g33610 [Oryza sativa Japonica Group]